MSPHSEQMELTASQEDYLEAILALIGQAKVARVRDIAGRLGVGKSAVTAALKNLSDRGMVNYSPYEYITLTRRGQKRAEQVDRRHRLLRDFLHGVLGLDEPTAESNACRMEHIADQVVLDRLRHLGDFVLAGGDDDADRWRKDFLRFCDAADLAESEEPS